MIWKARTNRHSFHRLLSMNLKDFIDMAVESLTIAIQLLPTESERVYIANEFLQLARRCHLNPSFIAAFEAIISTGTGQGS